MRLGCTMMLAVGLFFAGGAAQPAAADPVMRFTMSAIMRQHAAPPGRACCALSVPVDFQFTIDPVHTQFTETVEDGTVFRSYRFMLEDVTQPLTYSAELLALAPPSSPTTTGWASYDYAYEPLTGETFRGHFVVRTGVGNRVRAMSDDRVNVPAGPFIEPSWMFAWQESGFDITEDLWTSHGALSYMGGASVTDVAAVPEPATLLLLGGGLAGAFVRRRMKGREAAG